VTQPGRSLAIVVPAYNEESRLPRLLATVAARQSEVLAAAGMTLTEVVVVDDGSTDGTRAVVDAFGGLGGRLRLIALAGNRGKGAAARAGVLAVDADFVLVTDADLSTPLEEVRALAAALDDGHDVAMASRGLSGSRIAVRQPVYRELAGKAFNRLFRLLTRLPYRDAQCGFKLYRLATTRRAFELQRVDGFAYDAELCVNARRLGLRIAEVPVEWRNDPETKVSLVGASLEMALDLLRIAWRSRRPLPAGYDEPAVTRPGVAR